MSRLTLLAKGNVDVHDSLHSCAIGGKVCWNGINEHVRQRHAGSLVRLKHETWTRSDAILAADGQAPTDVSTRALPLGPYPAQSQFGTTLFDTDADAVVMSILPDTATRMFRHRQSGYLLHANDAKDWSEADRAWLRRDFEDTGLLAVPDALANLEAIVDRIRTRADVPILVYNMSPIVPGESVHNYAGLDEIYSTRVKRFNLALIELSERTAIDIVDVEAILAKAGAERLKLDVMHLTPEAYELIAAEVVRILENLGLFDKAKEATCEPA